MKEENIFKFIVDYINEWFINNNIGPDSVKPIISDFFNQLYNKNHQLNCDCYILYMFVDDFIDKIYSSIDVDYIKKRISCKHGDGNE